MLYSCVYVTQRDGNRTLEVVFVAIASMCNISQSITFWPWYLGLVPGAEELRRNITPGHLGLIIISGRLGLVGLDLAFGFKSTSCLYPCQIATTTSTNDRVCWEILFCIISNPKDQKDGETEQVVHNHV